MVLAAFAGDGQALLDALGVEKIDREHLTLKPTILNAERAARGEEALTYLKWL